MVSYNKQDQQSASVAPLHIAAAWGVHALTASGAIAGLLAILAIADYRWLDAFAWMGLTVLIDGVDGSLARVVGVKRILPGFDGALLDNVVDYFTYVLVPAFFVCEAEIIQENGRLPVAAAMILSSAYQFCQVDAKTADHYFKGWPSYWNIAIFYLFVLELDPLLNLVFVLGCVVLVFIPIRYLYPSRIERFRLMYLLVTFAWAVSLIVIWFQYPAVHAAVLILSISYVVYYHGASLYATIRRP
jgi:phosphatidylcholine synthase